ncbi:GNAT family N-acetyltransferase [Allosphingosinicella vermicomposti]|uniref:GNAT family N-acetyltransferase n=1 Tax=Allosphingosinicella vermicomposti TaxID=614671 RepID=UPI000D1085E7|nr:N-acetyltransferase [Allosphingosinicella vermicomposti]
MPSLVNPMDAFKTFEPALKRGELKVQQGDTDPNLLVHLDHPMGEMRITYAKMRGESVGAIAMIINAEPFEGKPVFQIGYAVPQHLRKRGLGKEIAQAAIAEFTAGMARNGMKSFYIEAIVGIRNIASQKVAEQVIGGPTKEVADEHSGEAALQYMRKIEAA